MAEASGDFDFICLQIEDEKEFLNTVSQEIWKNPELGYKETKAHALLSNTLTKFGFDVQKHYLLETAFRGECSSINGSGPTVAILLEYDALPEIGHACGHNLIAEAGLAASVAIKRLMDRDPSILGKLVVMGTPAEEGGGGKLRLIEKGAFKDIDVALMVHPTSKSCADPPFLCIERGYAEFRGKESHAAAAPWNGVNALDAAVVCYNNLSVLRQQIKPFQRIHVIIKEGGVATNIIPAKSRLELCVRSPTSGELKKLKSQVEQCIKGAAMATGCEVTYEFDGEGGYQNVIHNKILAQLYTENFQKLGYDIHENNMDLNAGSTDLGNVSHVVPAIHPFFAIPTDGINHTKEFTKASGLPDAQGPTLAAAKAMAMVAVEVFRNPEILKQIKKQFNMDLLKNLSTD